MLTRKGGSLAVLALAISSCAHAANLDVTAAYKMRAVSFTNLNLDASSNLSRNERSFIGNDARLGVAVRKIALDTHGGEESTLDLALTLHALGVSGSTAALTAPFDRAARYYPSTDMTPFIENAYVRVHKLFGKEIDATFGRQTFKLGSGLLLDDDGAGLTGISVKGALPWWGMQLEGFVFHDKNPDPNVTGPNSLDLFGFSLSLPSEGTWQLNQLIERDRSSSIAYGCFVTDPVSGLNRDCRISKAVRSFTSVRYQLNYGPMVFEGEAAMQKGAATPSGLTPAPNHITYNGNAQVARAKWKQRLYKTGEGIARLSVARGSGDDNSTPTRDEAFFPSHGHRYSGLERSGFGDFFGATPYDAWGGNYASSTTASGLRGGNSGILVVGAGYTPPAWRGLMLDIDYYLFQAERVITGPRTLGTEWDLRLRYGVLDRFTLALGAAFFSAGQATNPIRSSAKKYSFEASGRF